LSSSVVNALNYPNLKVGPYNWKYFQGMCIWLCLFQFS
jgi:hypothetical protein